MWNNYQPFSELAESEISDKFSPVSEVTETNNILDVAIIHHNLQSMGNCFDQIVSLLNNNEDCNFLCVTEHWQSIQELQAYNIDKFRLASSYCRQVGEHGGSAIYIKEGLKWKPRKDLEELAEHYIFECSAIQVYLENFKIVLLSIYRNSMSNVEHFFLKLESCLSILVNENVTVFIAGD